MADLSSINASLATESDIPDLVALVNSAYRGDSSRAGWTTEADILDGIRIDADGIEEILADPHAAIHTFWKDHIELVACVYLKEEPDHLYLGMLSVRPTLQTLGLGKHILQYAENIARQKELQRIHMTVIDCRTELIAWYNRHGYQPTGETEPWIDDVHVGLRKRDFQFIVLEKRL
jgi:ribosomal protein S18 acetylase RimI-like enzyme